VRLPGASRPHSNDARLPAPDTLAVGVLGLQIAPQLTEETCMQGSPRPGFTAFAAWNIVGVGAFLGLLTVLTIGIFVLPITALALAGLVFWPRTRNESAIGVTAGMGELALYIAYLNRGGPGRVCTRTGTSEGCIDEWSPWPWLVVGLALMAASVAAFFLVRQSAHPRTVATGTGNR
jgi:hypothetical protein